MRHDELQGQSSLHRLARYGAPVGIDATGDVQRQNRCRLRVEGGDQRLRRPGARSKPRPNRASTQISASGSAPSKSVMVPPSDVNSDAARCASDVAGGLPGKAITVTARPAFRAWRASTAVATVVACSDHHADPLRLRPMLQQALPGGLAGLRHQTPTTLGGQRRGLRIKRTRGSGIEKIGKVGHAGILYWCTCPRPRPCRSGPGRAAHPRTGACAWLPALRYRRHRAGRG